MAQVVKVGRNDPCSCGSGKKFKKCCEAKQGRSRGAMMMAVLVGVLLVGGLVSVAVNFSTEAPHTAKTTGVWSPEHGHYH
jgi:hypothetical protein